MREHGVLKELHDRAVRRRLGSRMVVKREQMVALVDLALYAQHLSWRCNYRTRYGRCTCGLDGLCDELGIDRVPPDDPEAKGA